MDLKKLVYCCLVRFRVLLAQLFDVGPEFLSHTSLYLMRNFFSFIKSLGIFHTMNNSGWICRNIKLSRASGKSSGQNPLLSHTIAIAFLLLLIIIIISVLTTLRDDYSNFIGKNEISQVCLLLKGSIEKVFTEDGYTSPTNTTKGRLFLRLPERIADQNYRIRFVNNSISVETLSQPRINDTCVPGFNLTYLGFTSGGMTELNFTLRDNGNGIIAIRKV